MPTCDDVYVDVIWRQSRAKMYQALLPLFLSLSVWEVGPGNEASQTNNVGMGLYTHIHICSKHYGLITTPGIMMSSLFMYTSRLQQSLLFMYSWIKKSVMSMPIKVVWPIKTLILCGYMCTSGDWITQIHKHTERAKRVKGEEGGEKEDE